MSGLIDFLSNAWVPWLLLAAVFGAGGTWRIHVHNNASKEDVAKAISNHVAECELKNKARLDQQEKAWQQVNETAIVVSRIEGYLSKNGYQR